MLDKKTEMMLSVANVLTAEDLDQIRAFFKDTIQVLWPLNGTSAIGLQHLQPAIDPGNGTS